MCTHFKVLEVVGYIVTHVPRSCANKRVFRRNPCTVKLYMCIQKKKKKREKVTKKKKKKKKIEEKNKKKIGGKHKWFPPL